MAIYTRWGNEVTIIARAAPVNKTNAYTKETFAVTPVKIHFDSGEEHWRIMESLKATDAWPELQAAVNAAPLEKMTKAEIKEMLQD